VNEIKITSRSFAQKFELKWSLGGPLSKLCVTPPFSINFRCQMKIRWAITGSCEPLVIEVTVPTQKSERSCIVESIDFVSLYDYSVWFWKCYNSMVLFLFFFIVLKHYKENSLRQSQLAWYLLLWIV
jgi:hypothetical protein